MTVWYAICTQSSCLAIIKSSNGSVRLLSHLPLNCNEMNATSGSIEIDNSFVCISRVYSRIYLCVVHGIVAAIDTTNRPEKHTQVLIALCVVYMYLLWSVDACQSDSNAHKLHHCTPETISKHFECPPPNYSLRLLLQLINWKQILFFVIHMATGRQGTMGWKGSHRKSFSYKLFMERVFLGILLAPFPVNVDTVDSVESRHSHSLAYWIQYIYTLYILTFTIFTIGAAAEGACLARSLFISIFDTEKYN